MPSSSKRAISSRRGEESFSSRAALSSARSAWVSSLGYDQEAFYTSYISPQLRYNCMDVYLRHAPQVISRRRGSRLGERFLFRGNRCQKDGAAGGGYLEGKECHWRRRAAAYLRVYSRHPLRLARRHKHQIRHTINDSRARRTAQQ